ncbi:hypothetical protein DFH07DRAFT_1054533 [Mycena maculata]|uniref:Uncharacterized protein n=1 Tax=Mycena maculata TaxID=230809 RepID=A0AAD7KI33_9AGAR|nr:hypothetical protein DFH07DRAFT_1054533 [Mycena maculata]
MLSFQRSFSVNPAVLAPGHPYPSSTCIVHFFEFRGTGPPSPDFGQAGDVYIDLNPRMHALYWRDRDIARGFGVGQWRRWNALLLDKVPLYEFLVPHPWARSAETSDLYLWVDPGGITWTSKDNLCASRVQMIRKNIAPVAPNVVPDVDALVSEILHRMLEREQPIGSVLRGDGPQSNRLSQPHSSRAGPSSQDFGRPSTRRWPGSPHRVQTSPDSFPSHRHRSSPFPNDYGPGGSRPFGPPSSTYTGGPPDNPYNQPTEQERIRAAHAALEGMQRAQAAEMKSKQELKLKSRELATLRKKEKDVIGMSYLYQKREQELVAALAAAERRSSGELEEMRATVHTLQKQAEAAQQQTRSAVEQVRRSEEELAATQREIQNLQSHLAFAGPRKNP